MNNNAGYKKEKPAWLGTLQLGVMGLRMRHESTLTWSTSRNHGAKRFFFNRLGSVNNYHENVGQGMSTSNTKTWKTVVSLGVGAPSFVYQAWNPMVICSNYFSFEGFALTTLATLTTENKFLMSSVGNRNIPSISTVPLAARHEVFVEIEQLK